MPLDSWPFCHSVDNFVLGSSEFPHESLFCSCPHYSCYRNCTPTQFYPARLMFWSCAEPEARLILKENSELLTSCHFGGLVVRMNVHSEGGARLFLDTTYLAGVKESGEVNLRVPAHSGLVLVAESTLRAAPCLALMVEVQDVRDCGSKVW